MIEIRPMVQSDTATVMEMMRTFYASPAVYTNGSEDIFQKDVENCINGNPYLSGYIFTENGQTVGYAMTAHSFSTEFGKPCIWIEDIYLQPKFRGLGIAGQFFSFLESKHPHVLLRLEVERDNAHAVAVYKKNGFDALPYMELKKDLG